MNNLNLQDETLHELLTEMHQLIKSKGLQDKLAIDQIAFRTGIDDNCRQIPVCSQVTDPLTNKTRTVCHMQTVCD